MILYARKQPSIDDVCAFDVSVWYDKQCTRDAAFYRWHHGSKPDKRHKHIMHNCCKYVLQWLPDMTDSDYPRLVIKTSRATYWEVSPRLYNTTKDATSGYYSLHSLMCLKGDRYYAEYGKESK